MTIKASLLVMICAATIGHFALSTPAFAQEKTVKACEDEWKADKAANQAKKITQKAYVEKCRASGAAAKPADAPAAMKKEAAPTAAPKAEKEKKPAAMAGGSEKTVKACEDEWRADKAANQAKKITQKAYVEKCRGGATTAAPAAAPAAPAAPAPAAPAAAPKTTSAPPASPMAPKEAKTEPKSEPKSAAVTPAAPTGANQYAAEAQAKSRCPSDTVVWANLDSKIYHFVGHDDYGHTKKGAYMCEKDALAQKIRAAKNEKRPAT